MIVLVVVGFTVYPYQLNSVNWLIRLDINKLVKLVASWSRSLNVTLVNLFNVKKKDRKDGTEKVHKGLT